jgi:uncharacterized protein (DUF885 family)
MRIRRPNGGLLIAIVLLSAWTPAFSQTTMTNDANDLHAVIEEFEADQGSLGRLYRLSGSGARRERFDTLYAEWQARLKKIPAKDLSPAGKADAALFANFLARRRRQLEIEGAEQAKLEAILPFADSIIALEESRALMKPIDPAQAAVALDGLSKQVHEAKQNLNGAAKDLGYSAVEQTRELRRALERWFKFYDGYDPVFSWWNAAPYKQANEALESFEKELSDKTLGPGGTEIVGRAVGREALMADLASEMIPYTPEELIAFGEREYAWCEKEMKKASRELGYGDDWKKALEHVKGLYVPPGKQTELVRNLALEAIEYVESRNLVTVPELAKETWRMEMMAPERQLVSPFFLGGETIIVSYPTDTMTHEQKMMSMRGNNPHFSRATVQHELIPGHHLQQFMESRYRPYRRLFGTPFWVEGWALYWEMLLWDLGFPQKPEDRIGMLFWRMHRCVRVSFSLRFHLGELTPQQCVDMLVDRVGHERANAEGEVRRSFNGSYPPLYQAAYLIGGLQFRALRRELVDSGKMTDREFHDAILHENNIPVPMLRAILLGQDPSDKSVSNWRFEVR